MSQPALSAQVRKLEGYLGARIFERSRNGVLMTKPGAALVERARLGADRGQHLTRGSS